MLSRLVRLLVVSAALSWGLAGLMLWAGQERLLFPAPAVGPMFLERAAEHANVQVGSLTAADGVRIATWTSRGGHDRLLLFFHGNGATLRGSTWVHDFGREHGWDVVSVAWRGYPGSEGTPSEAGFRLDAVAAWEHVTDGLGVAPERVVPYGHSLGGALAVWLAHERAVGAVVVDSSFRSMVAMAQRTAPLFPVRWMLRHPLDTEALAPGVTVPTLVVHSRDDGLIPVEHGRALAQALPRARYIELGGYGHNAFVTMTVAEVREQLSQFLDQQVSGPGAGHAVPGPPPQPPPP